MLTDQIMGAGQADQPRFPVSPKTYDYERHIFINSYR